MKNFTNLDWITIILVIIGAVNWGLVGLFGFDLVATIFGDMSAISRIIYIFVGFSGLYQIFSCGKYCRK